MLVCMTLNPFLLLLLRPLCGKIAQQSPIPQWYSLVKLASCYNVQYYYRSCLRRGRYLVHLQLIISGVPASVESLSCLGGVGKSPQGHVQGPLYSRAQPLPHLLNSLCIQWMFKLIIIPVLSSSCPENGKMILVSHDTVTCKLPPFHLRQ